MKCPKCGYNSFESYDSCKKCSSDLSGYKMTYGITPIVLPLAAREKMAEEYRATAVDAQPDEAVEAHEDMFALDLPEDSISSSAPFDTDPFNFDEEPPVVSQKQPTVEEDPFADLLETTPQVASDPFGASPTAAPQTAPKPVEPPSETGEFDLENFTWDDTPTEASTIGKDGADDDFDSLFGDMDESSKK